MQKPRAVGLLPVCLTVKPVGEPDALIGHVRFDERGWETERCRMAQATAPILDSTGIDQARCLLSGRYRGVSGLIADMLRPPSLTHMYGPAVRRKRISSIWRMCGLVRGRDAHFWAPPA